MAHEMPRGGNTMQQGRSREKALQSIQLKESKK